MLRKVIILFFISLSLEWIVGIEMDGTDRRNKTELRTNKRIQEKRRFDNLHTNKNKLNRAEERRIAQPLRYLNGQKYPFYLLALKTLPGLILNPSVEFYLQSDLI